MVGSDTFKTGSCECGSVQYKVSGPLRQVIACHCTQCRKTSGHFWAATQALLSDIKITDKGSLTWFKSSEDAERGFCGTCGASLFWRKIDSEHISIGAGTLDGSTGLSTSKHIYVSSKGDYYGTLENAG